jgi:Family of unknown function (DUF6157)
MSIAGLEHALLIEAPYQYTCEELILNVHRYHKSIDDTELDAFKSFLFAKSHPCMRLSMLTKRWGWGVHYNELGRLAIYVAETQEYHHLSTRSGLRVLAASPSSRLARSQQRTSFY